MAAFWLILASLCCPSRYASCRPSNLWPTPPSRATAGRRGRTLFTSFAPQVQETIRTIDPKAGLLGSVDRRSAEMMRGGGPMLDRFLALEGCGIAVERNLMMADPDWFVRRIGSGRVGVWMANTVDEIHYWMGQPIRQITTDRPDLAILERDGG